MVGGAHFVRGGAICVGALLVGLLVHDLYTASSRTRAVEIAFCAKQNMGYREIDGGPSSTCLDQQGLEHSIRDVIRDSQLPTMALSSR